jgi:hypothetical protein
MQTGLAGTVKICVLVFGQKRQDILHAISGQLKKKFEQFEK